MPQADIPCAVGFMFCSISKTMWLHIATLSRRLPAKTCHRQLYRSDRYVVFSDTPIFSFEKEKQKNERTVKTNGDLSFRNKSSQPWHGTKRCCCCGIYPIISR